MCSAAIYRQKSRMDPYWRSSEYFWQLSPGNGQFLVGFGIDGNWAWFCELLLTSFYQPLKLWRCVKRRPISIVQLFADQMKNIFCPIDDFFDTHNWSSCFEVLNSFHGIRSFFVVYAMCVEPYLLGIVANFCLWVCIILDPLTSIIIKNTIRDGGSTAL